MADASVVEAARLAAAVRRDVIQLALKQHGPCPTSEGHSGGRDEPQASRIDVAEVFSSVDILAALYTDFLRHRPDHPAWPERDRMVPAKPSVWPALGAILFRLGYFEDESLGQIPNNLHDLAGIDFSARTAEAGFGAGVGMAMALRDDGRTNRVVVFLDGRDLDDGRMWEAATTASSEKLSGLCVLIDQCRPALETERSALTPEAETAERLRAFGWETHVFDGHSFGEIRYALTKFRKHGGPRPYALVARTRRGGGSRSLVNGAAQTQSMLEAALKEAELAGR